MLVWNDLTGIIVLHSVLDLPIIKHSVGHTSSIAQAGVEIHQRSPALFCWVPIFQISANISLKDLFNQLAESARKVEVRAILGGWQHFWC